MAFGAVTILMDTLHQHFLQPTPHFPLRNKTNLKSLHKNLSSLQTSLEQDFNLGEYDEAIKGLEAQLRDVSVELRFQIEHHLRLFYLGKSMKVRLHSAQNLLPILNRAIKDTKTMDFDSMLRILPKHFMLPVSGMPAHIKKRVKSFCTQHHTIFYHHNIYYKSLYKKEESEDEQESKDEQEIKDEEEREDEQEIKFEEESEDEQEMKDEEEKNGDQKSKDEQRRCMLYEAESIIRQELRASYLNKYMKQRIEAKQRICQIFRLGIKLTSYIKKELSKVKNANDQSKNSQNNNAASPTRPELDNITVGDSLQQTSKSAIKMLGCHDEFNTIMDKLKQQSSKREIVSIVGMGGIGKTTLARKLYGDASVISHFDCRAWVTISQEYNSRQVFIGLLHSLGRGVCKNNETSNTELAELVYRCLKHQRYLIVIDDIWSTDVWGDLQKCFPDDNNGSRVLLTTRLKNVAAYASTGSDFCHNKCFLGSHESWELFRKVLSERIILSPKFDIIAREIVEKCKGLPLAISVAAGLLSNSKKTIKEWERIAKNVPTLSLDHSNQLCENIIHLSYTFLPHHLKLCFLSFGCFPEDYEIYEDVIVNFWVSEGFLKVLRSKRLEDAARESLQDLVDRNLVLICEQRSRIGGLSKTYQMHDVLRELALREAQKENLLYSKRGNGMGLRYKRIPPVNSSHISQPWSTQSRICSYKCLTHSSNTSSFIDVYNYTRLVHMHSKFLRALVLHGFHNIVLEIAGLVHLRWLKIGCDLNIYSLPLFMLRNLQKLELHSYSSCDSLDIWGLPQLRNLSIREGIALVPPRSVHHNLERIRFLDYRSCTKELFVRIPNLRTLGITSTHHSECKVHNWFESLAYLYKLEELLFCGIDLQPEFKTLHSVGILSLDTFLPNLKKLQLFDTNLRWKDVDLIGTLSKLEELKLRAWSVHGRKWEPREGGFHGLKFLAMTSCDLQCWEATSGHFPVLECLAFMYMGYNGLEEIPSGFADIATLKSISLFECSDQFMSSAKRIQEEQREYGNDALVVDIVSREEANRRYLRRIE